MATAFGWKRKVTGKLPRKRAAAFDESEQNNHEDRDVPVPFEDDWRVLIPKPKGVMLEDIQIKSRRLKDEGATLAEQKRYWEATARWNEAISLTPNDERLHEMKSQALMELNELFPAIQAAERAVAINALWATGHQSLGRAQLGLGEIELALKSFSKAVHLQPDDAEMWNDDLLWAKKLQDQKQQNNETQEKDEASKVDADYFYSEEEGFVVKDNKKT